MTSYKQDVVVVGAGIVGLAVSMRLLRRCPSLRVTLLEKESEIASHQTGHNSGVIHSGIYYKPGSLKATLCHAGRTAMVEFCAAEGIAHDVCGKIVVALDEADQLRATLASPIVALKLVGTDGTTP